MNRRKEYLSDKELLMLIEEAEQKDKINAPPDMEERILAYFDEERSASDSDRRVAADSRCRDRKREYRNYCVRVWTSVAAAIAMVFLLPREISLPVPEERVQTIWEESMETSERKSIGIFEDFSQGENIFGSEDRFRFFLR